MNRQFYCGSVRYYWQNIGNTYSFSTGIQPGEANGRTTKKVSEQFGKHADVINQQGKQLTALYQIHQRDYKKLLQLIQLYSELSACGVMDSKRKENLKAEITNLINT